MTRLSPLPPANFHVRCGHVCSTLCPRVLQLWGPTRQVAGHHDGGRVHVASYPSAPQAGWCPPLADVWPGASPVGEPRGGRGVARRLDVQGAHRSHVAVPLQQWWRLPAAAMKQGWPCRAAWGSLRCTSSDRAQRVPAMRAVAHSCKGTPPLGLELRAPRPTPPSSRRTEDKQGQVPR